ncbi:MAG: hypothetical protein KDA90_02755 [Planctomycetaceae bacterium]|nr:hypothetical protein [Planctomycetaceae bacterium]
MRDRSNVSIGIKDLLAISHLCTLLLDVYTPSVRAAFLEEDFSVDILNLDCTVVTNERVVRLMSVANDIASSFDFPSVVVFWWIHSTIGLPMLWLKRDIRKFVFDLVQGVTQELEGFVMRTRWFRFLKAAKKLMEAFCLAQSHQLLKQLLGIEKLLPFNKY